MTDREAVIEYGERIGQLIFTNYSTDIEYSNKYESFEEEYPSDR
jgi:deoxycytidine triphosphate deaminase